MTGLTLRLAASVAFLVLPGSAFGDAVISASPIFTCPAPAGPLLSDEEMFARANALPDGRHVYVDMNGRWVFDVQGRRMTPEELAAFPGILPVQSCRMPQR